MLDRNEVSPQGPELPDEVITSLREAFDSHHNADWAAAGLESATVHHLGPMHYLPTKLDKKKWETNYREPIYVSDRSYKELDLPDGGNEELVVRMGQWAEGQAGQTLITRNLGPCIGIGIYEPLSKTGFLLHEPLPEDTGGVFMRFEDRLRQVFAGQPGAFEGMKAWLAGGSAFLPGRLVSESEAEAFVEHNRRFTETALRDIGIPNESIKLCWTPDGYATASMALDCSTGTCEVEYY